MHQFKYPSVFGNILGITYSANMKVNLTCGLNCKETYVYIDCLHSVSLARERIDNEHVGYAG